MAKKKKQNSNNQNENLSSNQAEEMITRDIFVFAEIIKKSDKMTLHAVVPELLNAARELADKYTNMLKVCSIICTDYNIDSDFEKRCLSGFGHRSPQRRAACCEQEPSGRRYIRPLGKAGEWRNGNFKNSCCRIR